jgi:hypothetical protein
LNKLEKTNEQFSRTIQNDKRMNSVPYLLQPPVLLLLLLQLVHGVLVAHAELVLLVGRVLQRLDRAVQNIDLRVERGNFGLARLGLYCGDSQILAQRVALVG